MSKSKIISAAAIAACIAGTAGISQAALVLDYDATNLGRRNSRMD